MLLSVHLTSRICALISVADMGFGYHGESTNQRDMLKTIECLSFGCCRKADNKICVRVYVSLPGTYRESWKALAAGRGPPDAGGAAQGQHVHLQFCNMIINDSTYLLGEALEKLPEVRDLEALMDNKAAWQALPKREQQEKESVLRQESEYLAPCVVYNLVVMHIAKSHKELHDGCCHHLLNIQPTLQVTHRLYSTRWARCVS